MIINWGFGNKNIIKIYFLFIGLGGQIRADLLNSTIADKDIPLLALSFVDDLCIHNQNRFHAVSKVE